MPEEENMALSLILNDGTVLEDCECGYYDKSLWCTLKGGITFAEAFQYFSTPNKFKTVTFVLKFGEVIDKIKYSGFEEVTAVLQHEDSVEVRLQGFRITQEKTREYVQRLTDESEEPTNEGGE